MKKHVNNFDNFYKSVNENQNVSEEKLKEIADSFTRYLIGNSRAACRELEEIDPFINPMSVFENDMEGYNKFYKELQESFFKLLKDKLEMFEE
jgi:transposase